MKTIAEDRTHKIFRKVVNKKTRKREGIDESITETEGRNHFTKQFNGVSIKEEEEKIKRKKNGVEEISTEEVKNVIGNLEKGKVTGPDGIQNEAWIHGKEEVKYELRNILNKIWKGERRTIDELRSWTRIQHLRGNTEK